MEGRLPSSPCLQMSSSSLLMITRTILEYKFPGIRRETLRISQMPLTKLEEGTKDKPSTMSLWMTALKCVNQFSKTIRISGFLS